MLVLTYHSISDGSPPLCVSAARLGEHLDFLCGAGLSAVPLRDVIAAVAAGEPPRRDAFAITFDDGYRDFRESALPVLEERGLPATLFAVAQSPASDTHAEDIPGGTGGAALTTEELRDVASRGVEIGGHSLSHVDLTRLADASLERELAEGRRVLEERAGVAVESFAYPFGSFDARTRAAVRTHFAAGFTTQLAAVPAGIDPYAIPRVDAFYLDSASLRNAIAAGRPGRYLTPRRWLRRVRGSEPRVPLAVRSASGPRLPAAPNPKESRLLSPTG